MKQQKTKKQRRKERIIWATIIAIAAVIIAWLLCWLAPYGYPGPFCGSALAGGGFVSGGTSGTSGTCPSGGTYTCPAYSCDDCTPPEGRSPCGTADDYTCGGYCPELYTCESLMYIIEGSDYDYPSVGCACMPVYPAEGGDNRYCGMESGQCGGACETGATCQQISDTACSCVPDVTPCYLASARTCGGGCESPYESCTYDAKYETCYCQSNLY